MLTEMEYQHEQDRVDAVRKFYQEEEVRYQRRAKIIEHIVFWASVAAVILCVYLLLEHVHS